MKYIDRNGKKIIDDSRQDKLLHLLYTHAWGRALLKPLVAPGFSGFAGRLLDTRLSTRLVPGFIKNNHIDMSGYQETEYRSFNDFFSRKIKAGARIFSPEETDLISPCDCYASAYRIDPALRVNIKDTTYSAASLLRSKKLAARYAGGTLLVLRLTVGDYHRYHYPVSGIQSKNHFIPGILHTVNPIANDYIPIYKENAREYTVIRSPQFGDVTQMEVGAMLVGKICNHRQSCRVFRGEEKGYFQYGGSTIVLFLEKDAVMLRPDLMENTRQGYETQLHLGDTLGHSPWCKDEDHTDR